MFEKIYQVLKMGGLPLWFMLLGSVLTIVVFVERSIYLWRFLPKAEELCEQVRQFLANGERLRAEALCARSPHPMATIFSVGLVRSKDSLGSIAAVVDRQRQRTALSLRRPLWILGTIGATTPFIGLFGTVVGIMGAFHALSTSKKAGFEVVGPGIAEALISTAVGIGVAIVALIGFNYFQTRIGRINVELKLLTEEFLESMEFASLKKPIDRDAE